MAPLHDHSPLYQRSLLPCIPPSWPLLALCSATSAFIGLVFFIVGLVGVIGRSESSKARDWIFLSFGIALLTVGISLIVLCRIRMRVVQSTPSQRRRRRGATRPMNRHEPLPVWTMDAVDPSFRPPPDYYEAIHCSPSTPTLVHTVAVGSRPPPYTPSPMRHSRTTDV